MPEEESAKYGFPPFILAQSVNFSGLVLDNSEIASKSHVPRIIVLNARLCLSNGISSLKAGS